MVYLTIVHYLSLWTSGGRPSSAARRRSVHGTGGPKRMTTGGACMLHSFTPQEVFLVVFCGVIFVAYLVNRAHCYDMKRNRNQAH